jgi:2-dehydro-3-deoxyphosphogluconate aldolase/(4S)-4-hydroxy-2-oxoglutarate aldolase
MTLECLALLRVLERDRVIAVIRAGHVADAEGLGRVLALHGIGAVEVTMTTIGALSAIGALRETGAMVGAGTVLTADAAHRCVAAGAQYLVTPTPIPDVAEAAHREGVPVLLGALTPTEVALATRLGSLAVKIFPARLVGPDYLRDLRGPFPDLQLIPSGGIDADNAVGYLDAGALAVSAGGSTIPAAAVERGDLGVIAERVSALTRSLGRVVEAR